ncbi:class I SAM-dependent methyltransferase [Tsukamurella asaccharolytica]|uniref:Class I SAM-dependent methyltransferase n=1 Tax=Tsukamurella asaccharolytica TaxID=2592067 RepID=A0A5C5R7U8_9ACTN|nr:class I SAM-dependent methyltransferase [Tsukamurella asaccharolytica]TWS18514.1 class I SAM-dependent methyltransferase [Tsukamurella asaccharolytica]
MRSDSAGSEAANRSWWDSDVEAYHAEHAEFLGVDAADGGFVWCPEGLDEADAELLGPVGPGTVAVEIGCGSAPCARWLAARGATVVGIDISAGMLRRGLSHVREGNPLLAQAGGENLPIADGCADIVCSAFGAIPFVADSARVMTEAHRVLRPGGRFVFAVTHPMRWIFLDDPGPDGLVATLSYFDRSPYVETDDDGVPTYVEHHRTMGDRVREIVGAGLRLVDVIEPEWPEGFTQEWGQWSPLRGAILPGTAIFVCEKPV